MATLRDPSLPHQVVLEFSGGSGRVQVSCNCRKNRWGYDPMGHSIDLDEARALYDDPENHRKAFRVEDRARW